MSPTKSKRHLSPKQLAQLRHLLEAERSQLLSLYRETVGRAEELQVAQAEDSVDQAEASWEKEELYASRQTGRSRLRLIDEALDRMERGIYGLCLHCETPILFARLEAVPAARYCAVHQEEVERGELEEADYARRREPPRELRAFDVDPEE